MKPTFMTPSSHGTQNGGENRVHKRPGEGYLHLVGGSLGKRLHPGQAAYRQEGYVLDLRAEPLGDERMPVLVQQHEGEERQDEPGHQDGAGQVPSLHVAVSGEEDQ